MMRGVTQDFMLCYAARGEIGCTIIVRHRTKPSESRTLCLNVMDLVAGCHLFYVYSIPLLRRSRSAARTTIFAFSSVTACLSRVDRDDK